MRVCERPKSSSFLVPPSLLAFPILLIVLGQYSLAQEEDNTPEAGRERLAKIAQKIEEEVKKRGNNAAAEMFLVPADALKESRGQTEDELRMYLLAFLPFREKLDKTIQILNSPWGAETVKNLWELHTYKETQQPYGGILNLLVYVATKYDRDVFTEVQRRLDDLFQKSCSPDWDPNSGSNSRLLSYMTDALERYGTLKLLPNSFWKAMEREEVGIHLRHVLTNIGDADTLKWLENFQRTCGWEDKRHLEWLSEGIDELRETLRRKQAGEKVRAQPKLSQGPEHQQPQQEQMPLKPGGEEQVAVEPVEKPAPLAATPEERKAPSLGADWLLPGLIIIGVVIAGVVLFLLLSRRKAQ